MKVQMAVLGSLCLISLISLVSWTSPTSTFLGSFFGLRVNVKSDFQSLGTIVKIEVAVLGRP